MHGPTNLKLEDIWFFIITTTLVIIKHYIKYVMLKYVKVNNKKIGDKTY